MDDLAPHPAPRPAIGERAIAIALAAGLLALPRSVFAAGESLWIVPKGFGKAGHSMPGVIITRLGSSSNLSPPEGVIVAFKELTNPEVAILQLHDIPATGGFKFRNFRTFADPSKFEDYLGGYLNDNGFRTVLDLSQHGERSDSGEYAAHLRARRLSKLYGVDVVSFDPIGLQVYDTCNARTFKNERRHLLGTSASLLNAWLLQITDMFRSYQGYIYYPHGSTGQIVEGFQEQRLDEKLHPGLVWINPYKGAGDFVRIWSQPGVYQEYSSSLYARLTRNGQESPLALHEAVQQIFGERLNRKGSLFDLNDKLKKGLNPDFVYYWANTARPDEPSRKRRR